jgi:hypothetical protein
VPHACVAALVIVAVAALQPVRALADTEDPQEALKQKTTEELFACVEGPGSDLDLSCGVRLEDVAEELGSRNIDHPLLAKFESASAGAKGLIVYALYYRALDHGDGANVLGVARVMESAAFGADSRHLDEDVVELAKAYLARKCDRRVLREWSSKPYVVRSPSGYGSWGYSGLVVYFGVCHYEPSVPYLLWLLDAASLNLASASLDALQSIYPNDKTFSSPAEARTYYSARHETARRG